MTEHEKKLLNQVPSDPRKRRNTEQLEEITLPKKKSGTQQTMKPNAMSIACKYSISCLILEAFTAIKILVYILFKEIYNPVTFKDTQ